MIISLETFLDEGVLHKNSSQPYSSNALASFFNLINSGAHDVEGSFSSLPLDGKTHFVFTKDISECGAYHLLFSVNVTSSVNVNESSADASKKTVIESEYLQYLINNILNTPVADGLAKNSEFMQLKNKKNTLAATEYIRIKELAQLHLLKLTEAAISATTPSKPGHVLFDINGFPEEAGGVFCFYNGSIKQIIIHSDWALVYTNT